jgi:hypothetical protein
MTYQIKDQDVTPPTPDMVEQRSVATDGLVAIFIAFSALGLIALILFQVID